MQGLLLDMKLNITVIGLLGVFLFVTLCHCWEISLTCNLSQLLSNVT